MWVLTSCMMYTLITVQLNTFYVKKLRQLHDRPPQVTLGVCICLLTLPLGIPALGTHSPCGGRIYIELITNSSVYIYTHVVSTCTMNPYTLFLSLLTLTEVYLSLCLSHVPYVSLSHMGGTPCSAWYSLLFNTFLPAQVYYYSVARMRTAGLSNRFCPVFVCQRVSTRACAPFHHCGDHTILRTRLSPLLFSTGAKVKESTYAHTRGRAWGRGYIDEAMLIVSYTSNSHCCTQLSISFFTSGVVYMYMSQRGTTASHDPPSCMFKTFV